MHYNYIPTYEKKKYTSPAATLRRHPSATERGPRAWLIHTNARTISELEQQRGLAMKDIGDNIPQESQ